MPATVNVLQQRQNIEGGFRVITTVQDSTLIPKELFVFVQSDNSFSHVAAMEDFFYPTVATQGVTNYRTAMVTRDFTEVDSALKFASSLKERILALAGLYTEAAARFVGSETLTLGG